MVFALTRVRLPVPLLCVTHALPQLLNVDGTSISGLDSDGVAAKLRGQEGSSVWIKVARRHSDIPGVAGLPPGEAPVEYKQFRVRRAQVELNPVFATTMSLDDHTYGAGRCGGRPVQGGEGVMRGLQLCFHMQLLSSAPEGGKINLLCGTSMWAWLACGGCTSWRLLVARCHCDHDLVLGLAVVCSAQAMCGW